jgi:aldehyde dehydrogenase (NAD+)
MRFYADLAYKMEEPKYVANISLHKEPIGVCAFINPWNYPLHQLTGKIAPALAAGCTIVTKPAEQTPIQDFIMAEIFDKVGLPSGVFNLISGVGKQIGPMMSSHPLVDMVSFTGSTAAGISVASAAAPTVKRVCQELGGKSAMIVTDDADLPAALRYAVEDVMANTGQTCNALTRLLIPQSRYDEALTLAKQFAEEQVVGDPFDAQTTMGPMASRRQLDTVLSYIDLGIQEGARLITGGKQPEGLDTGTYILPTIFADVSNDMRIAREEIFGPVLCIISYQDIEQAITIANDSVYGLSSAVYAKDKASAMPIAKRMRAGQCYIQGAYFSMHAPFGGYKQSGNGREWGEQGLEEYLETKAIIAG